MHRGAHTAQSLIKRNEAPREIIRSKGAPTNVKIVWHNQESLLTDVGAGISLQCQPASG